MVLLSVNGVTKHFGPEPVLDGVTFDVRAGERIALVGPNGTGKSTLMKILAGMDEPDSGTVERGGEVRIGYLEQHAQFYGDTTVWTEARQALAELTELAEESERIAAEMARTGDPGERRRLGDRFDRLQHELQQRDAFQIDYRVERVLEGLGFTKGSFHQPVNQLSGGQQNRLLLAKLLLSEPDLMLLDEPSNHLDIDATEWLEAHLMQSRQAWIIVSHDRYLLDQVTNRTVELLHGTVDSYPGNYSKYQQLKGERLEIQRRTFEKQQDEIARLEEFVRRFHAGQKHAQAEDRRKKLERIERVPPPREIEAPPMKLPGASRSGDLVLRAEGLSKAFDRVLFQNLSFEILRGEKWGILGRNGAGKTTLLRCILGQEPLDAGQVTLGTGVRVAYFDQQLKCVSDDALVVEAVRPDEREFPEQQRRDLLARFGIRGDMVFQPVHSLSGGERNRVALARLAATDANFLILDEPTNHLDLWARTSLEAALRAFDGTVLLVSHDRYFLNQVADRLLVVQPDRFRVVHGNYNHYVDLVRSGLAQSTSASAASKPTPAKSTTERRKGEKPPRRQRKFPYRKLEDLEAEITEREERTEHLHELLTEPDVLRDGQRVRDIKAELAEQQETLARLYEHWEEASELQG